MQGTESPATQPGASERTPTALALLALVLSAAMAAGSVALSMWEKKNACPLCFYQRTFAMSVAAVLGVGLLGRLARADRLMLLALPLALSGLGVAIFHVSLEMRGNMECPPGLLGIATAPQQGLATFAILTLLLAAGVVQGLRTRSVGVLGVVVALALSGALVWGSCNSNPPSTLKGPYANPVPDICRPPYVAN